jgi:hypothetical protein
MLGNKTHLSLVIERSPLLGVTPLSPRQIKSHSQSLHPFLFLSFHPDGKKSMESGGDGHSGLGSGSPVRGYGGSVPSPSLHPATQITLVRN